MRCILLFLFQLIFIFIFPFSVRANQNFYTEVTITYIYNQTGVCQVDKQFTITNLTSENLISSYELYFPGQLPDNLQGHDSGGKLNFQTESAPQGNKVRIFFNTIAAGKNEKLSFNISYSCPSAKNIDNRWEISLLKINTLEQIDKSALKLVIPEIFGNLVYSSVSPDSTAINESSKTFTFSDFLSNNQDVYSIFSQYKIWGFHLEYEISNPEPLNLPSDSPGQKIIIKSLSPSAENIVIDNSGQWQAVFPPSLKLPASINLTGQIQFSSSSPEFNFLSAGVNPSHQNFAPDVYLLPKTSLSLSWKIPLQILPFITYNSVLRFHNNGNAAAYNVPLSVTASGIQYYLDTNKIPVIPPGGFIDIPISLNLPLKYIFRQKYLVISTEDLVITYNIPAYHFLIFYGLFTITTAGLFITLAFFAYHTWSLHLQKPVRAGNLRRKSQ